MICLGPDLDLVFQETGLSDSLIPPVLRISSHVDDISLRDGMC